jgi:hypothetical protein
MKNIYISYPKAKKNRENKQGQERPKWKALKGFTFNIQAQAAKGERVRREIKGQEKSLEKKT